MNPILKFRPALAILAAAATLSCNGSPPPSSVKSGAPADAPPATRYEDHIWADGIAPPGDEPQNPHVADKESAKDGERLYASMNCDGCHGSGGSGWVGPSLADGRWRYGGRDEEVFSSIFYGRPKGMPAYGGLIGGDGVWTLVSYLKSLPKPDVVPTQSWIEPNQEEAAAAPQQTNAEAGAKPAGPTSELDSSMQADGCSACHALDRKIVGPAFSQVALKYHGQAGAEEKLFASAKNGSAGTWGTLAMPPNTAISDDELRRVVKQILSLK
jgi:cytochrome c oxidase cbb3-type subunit III